jgi:hypothetical protein
VHVAKLGLEGRILHYFMVLEQIIILLVDMGLSFIYAPLLAAELEILVPSWAFFNVPTHLMFTRAWERSMVLDKT